MPRPRPIKNKECRKCGTPVDGRGALCVYCLKEKAVLDDQPKKVIK